MSDASVLGGLPSPVDMSTDVIWERRRAPMRRLQLVREMAPEGAATERIGQLVERAMQSLESDPEVAWRCLNDASALLAGSFAVKTASAGDPNSTEPIASNPFRAGGLARWQARRAMAYIEENLESKLEVGGLAELVSFSKSHFSRAFKRSIGLPPMAYVTLRRIERAKLLMTSTHQHLTEIAFICGFADQSHLNRSFRRLIGVSPGCWRRTKAQASESTSGPAQDALDRLTMASACQGT
jgi:AraC family transcriptional regulator